MSKKRYRYTGMERDEETGLQCHGVRYYAVWLGRWVSADPIGLGDGGNRYAYVHAKPVLSIDRSGLAEPRSEERPWPPPLPPEPSQPYTPLTPSEVERRRLAVQQSAAEAQSQAPLASALILHWLEPTPLGGKDLVLSGEGIGLSKEDSGFPEYLRTTVRPAFAREAIRIGASLKPGDTAVVRLGYRALTPADLAGETTGFQFQPFRKDYSKATTANPMGWVVPQKVGADLSVSLGQVNVAMRASVRGVYDAQGAQVGVEVVPGTAEFAIVDRYDFHVNKTAVFWMPAGTRVPLPPEAFQVGPELGGYQPVHTSDTWMNDLQASGGAASFGIRVDYRVPDWVVAPVPLAPGAKSP